ncbi:hypothetical protein EC396_00905 [Lutibacter sp. HS1-25]|uniref:hypothetical protein n=1 Tax=Lutibacter sp. HS1-25 TaxID=2485000 RepID=UPI0010134239|nr:hypothetical protein [Lutibacter sp. HS1-25]RXP64564.1 hypothetical protein EC396_00905 [Lutibacter sp. HS1-25]
MKKQDKYRELLQNRSIQPSAGSWDTLSKKLDAQQNLQKNNKWSFLKYAAVILAIASVGFYFLKPKPEIISEEKIQTPVSNKELKSEPIINSKKETFIAEVEEFLEPVKSKNENEKPKNRPIEEVVVLEEEFAENTNISSHFEIDSTAIAETSIAVSDTEIEQLLKNAKIKVSKNHQNLNKKTISAQSLLVEVEDDLDKDLKDKLLQTIVTTLKTPREITISDRGIN